MASFSPEKLVAMVRAQPGWVVKTVKKGWILYPPDKSLPGITVHKTPGDENWHKQAIRLLRRSGLEPD